MVLRRDHVLMTFLLCAACAAAIFSARCPSTNGPFLTERAMTYSLTLLTAALHDHAVSPFVVAGLQPLCKLSPRRARMPASGGAAFAAAHRMVDRVHRDAAVVRATARPPRPTGLAERNVRVLDVGHLADRRVALQMNHPNFSGGKAYLRIIAVLRHQPRSGAGGSDHLRALALLELDVVDHRAERDVAKRHRVSGFDVGVLARHDRVSDFHPVRRQDVALVAVDIVQEGDAGGPVRVVLD